MIKTDEYIFNRVIWKAKKFMLPTNYSFFFNELSTEKQNTLLNQIDRDVCGQPILFFTKPNTKWTLICTKQIVCSDNEKIFAIDLKQIKVLQPTVFKTNNQLKEFKEQNFDKREWDEILLIDRNNREFILQADKGKDLFALWNILLMTKRFFD